jgi:hypothetical protein
LLLFPKKIEIAMAAQRKHCDVNWWKWRTTMPGQRVMGSQVPYLLTLLRIQVSEAGGATFRASFEMHLLAMKQF